MRRRLLVASPLAPSANATEGGARAIHGLLTRLAERHDVVLVHAALGVPDDDLVSACVAVHTVPVPHFGRWGRRARGAELILRGRSVYALESGVGAIRRRVREVAAEFWPDVLQAEYAILGDVLAAVPSATRVLTIHEPAACLRAGVGVRDAALPLVHRLDAYGALREERRGLRLADGVVAFTDDDRRLISRSAPAGKAIVTIPLGWDVPAAALDPVGDEPATIAFAGDYGHPPNVDAALRLAREVMPRVRAQQPDARLELIGPHPPPKLVALAGDGIEIAGRVPSVMPHLDRAAVVVAPIAIGGGMRVKVLEALAAGKAVVASRRALAGLAVRDGEHVLIADDSEATAAAVTRLLSDADARRRIATSARAWAEHTLSWSAMADRYDDLYDRLVSPAGQLEAAASP